MNVGAMREFLKGKPKDAEILVEAFLAEQKQYYGEPYDDDCGYNHVMAFTCFSKVRLVKTTTQEWNTEEKPVEEPKEDI